MCVDLQCLIYYVISQQLSVSMYKNEIIMPALMYLYALLPMCIHCCKHLLY